MSYAVPGAGVVGRANAHELASMGHARARGAGTRDSPVAPGRAAWAGPSASPADRLSEPSDLFAVRAREAWLAGSTCPYSGLGAEHLNLRLVLG